MGLPPRLSQAELRRLYEQERLSPAQIGVRVGRSGRTIRVWLEQAGIPLDPHRERPRRHPPPAASDLRRFYYQEYLTAAELADRYGVSASTARRWLRDAGMPRRVPGRRSRAPSGQELRRLYQDHGLSTTQIAQRYGVRQQTAYKWLRAAQIPLRPRRAAQPGHSPPLSGGHQDDHRTASRWRMDAPKPVAEARKGSCCASDQLADRLHVVCLVGAEGLPRPGGWSSMPTSQAPKGRR
jgi:transposase